MITLTTGHQNEFIDCHKAKVQIAVLPIVDVKTQWNLTVELLERAYWLREFTSEWLNNPNYSENQPLFPTRHEWTIVKYVMEVLMTFRYWTLWMLKSHTVTLHHVNQCLQWHVPSHGWHCASFRREEDTIEGSLILRCEGCPPETVQILCRSHSNNQAASHFSAYLWSFAEVAIIQEVGQGDEYESGERDVQYYQIPGRSFEVCGERILHQTSTNLHH